MFICKLKEKAIIKVQKGSKAINLLFLFNGQRLNIFKTLQFAGCSEKHQE